MTWKHSPAKGPQSVQNMLSSRRLILVARAHYCRNLISVNLFAPSIMESLIQLRSIRDNQYQPTAASRLQVKMWFKLDTVTKLEAQYKAVSYTHLGTLARPFFARSDLRLPDNLIL